MKLVVCFYLYLIQDLFISLCLTTSYVILSVYSSFMLLRLCFHTFSHLPIAQIFLRLWRHVGSAPALPNLLNANVFLCFTLHSVQTLSLCYHCLPHGNPTTQIQKSGCLCFYVFVVGKVQCSKCKGLKN